MAGQMIIVKIAGEEFGLLPERALYRFSNRTLMVADLHWGKAEVFQRSGVAVSSEVLISDLARLTRALAVTKAARLVVLGDLIHAPSGVTADVSRTVDAWRTQHADIAIELIRGNHDRRFTLPASWRIDVHDEALAENGFLLAHEPDSKSLLFVLGGHIHPVLRMKSGGDSLRLACFAIGNNSCLLPAFSEFTGGHEIKASEWLRLFLVTGEMVIEV